MDQVSESRQLDEALARWAGSLCPDCGAKLCDHGVLCAVALGLKDRPRCLSCAAKGLNRELPGMRQHLGRWLAGKDCYKKAWVRADSSRCETPCSLVGLLAQNSAFDSEEFPDAGTIDENESGAKKSDANTTAPEKLVSDTQSVSGSPTETPAIIHDFGDLGCGDLVLQLRRILRELPPGTVVRVLATDPGAPQDIPAWVRMTGHTLLAASHPVYDLKKRADP